MELLLSANNLIKTSSKIFLSAQKFYYSEIVIEPSFRNHIMEELITIKKALNNNYDKKIIHYFQYALAVFFDELILSSDHENRDQWIRHSLQAELFGNHLGGENFFNYLHELKQDMHRNLELLTIYNACLQLGFEGKYRLLGREKLSALKQELTMQIDSIHKKSAITLSSSFLKSNLTNKIYTHIPIWMFNLVTICIIIIVYLGFSFTLAHQANEIFAALKANSIVVMHKG